LAIYGNVTEVIKSDKDTKKRFEAYPRLFFGFAEIDELKNINNGKSWVNLSD